MKSLIKSIFPKSLWTKLRLWRMDNSITSYPIKQIRHTYGGFDLTVHLADPLAQGWYDCDWPELPEISLLRKHRLVENAKVFDIGAHQGIVALMLAKLVGVNGSVLAIEANYHNSEIARKNQELNGVDNLDILFGAVADKSGKLIFNRGLNGQVDDGTGDWGQVEVPSFSIDDLSRKYGFPDILFIDIEGFECQALQGAKQTLSRYPDCFIEVHVNVGLEKYGGSIEQIFAFFPEDKYDLFIHSETNPIPTSLKKSQHLLNERFFLTVISHQDRC